MPTRIVFPMVSITSDYDSAAQAIFIIYSHYRAVLSKSERLAVNYCEALKRE